MKKNYLILMCVLLALAWSCKKSSDNSTTTNTNVSTTGTVHQIKATRDTLSGLINGTMTTNGTYYLNGDVTVAVGNTLTVQPGVKVIALGNYTVYVRGIISSTGSQASPISFSVPDNLKHQSNNGLVAGYGGIWGGFNCDSATAITFKWTAIEYMGGPDATGSARLGISCKYAASLDLEDSWIRYCFDDGLRVHGTQNCIIRRNTFEHTGGNGGESINIKQGATGDISYNVIWNSCTKAIKLETDATVLYPQTCFNIYNNTIINSGFRNHAKPGPATSIDLNSRGAIYNNLYINCLRGIAIFQKADSAHTYYDYNGFFNTDAIPTDTVGGHIPGEAYYTYPLYQLYYDTTDKGVQGNPGIQGAAFQTTPLKPRLHDVRVSYQPAASQTVINNMNNYTSDLNTLDWLPFTTTGTSPYNVTLHSGSPFIGKGVITLPYMVANVTVVPTPGIDIGAKQTSGNLGNQH